MESRERHVYGLKECTIDSDAFVYFSGQRLIPEQALLRDIIYVLQGIDGKHVHFQEAEQVQKPSRLYTGLDIDSDEEEEAVDGRIAIIQDEVQQALPRHLGGSTNCQLQGQVPQPTRDLLHRLAELGWLYRKVERAVREKDSPKCEGMIRQASVLIQLNIFRKTYLINR
jgi:gamma-tubulin complex component 3